MGAPRFVNEMPWMRNENLIPAADQAPYMHFPARVSHVLAALQAFLLGTIMYGAWWLKLVIEEEVTVYDYLTNLVMIAIGTFYWLVFVGQVESWANHGAHLYRRAQYGAKARAVRPDYILHFATLAAATPVLSATTGVTFAVLAVLQDAPGLLFNYVSEYGEGTVVNANFFMHVFTTLSVMVYIFLTLDRHQHVLTVTFRGLVRVTVVNVVTALIALMTYIYGHSIPDVYDLDARLPASVVVIIFLIIIVGVTTVFNLVASPWNRLLVKSSEFWEGEFSSEKALLP